MKKTLLLFGIFFSVISFGQVMVIPESKEIDQLYKGGNKQFVQDVENNFAVFSSEFQVNGQFMLTFDLDKKGKVTNPKVSPEIDNDFAFAVIRSFKRVKNNFEPAQNTTRMSVLLDFNPKFKSDDGRERFTEPTSVARFYNR